MTTHRLRGNDNLKTQPSYLILSTEVPGTKSSNLIWSGEVPGTKSSNLILSGEVPGTKSSNLTVICMTGNKELKN